MAATTVIRTAGIAAIIAAAMAIAVAMGLAAATGIAAATPAAAVTGVASRVVAAASRAGMADSPAVIAADLADTAVADTAAAIGDKIRALARINSSRN
jgi:hypothetical protein